MAIMKNYNKTIPSTFEPNHTIFDKTGFATLL